MATMPPRLENKVIHHERRKAKWGACGKKKKGCWYGYGCFRVPTQIEVTGCPATTVLRNLKERTKATLMCLVSLSWKQPKAPTYSSSSSTPKPSKQPSASSDSHRNQAVQDCISYINSSTASSSSSSSSTVMARSPPPTSSVAQTPPSTIVTVNIPPPPPPPSSTIVTVNIPPPPPPPPPPLPHFLPISTTQNKSTSVIPSTCS